jgi:hypothetical protein
MTCKHKFYTELDLSYVDYEPEMLIVGTFNPEWPKANYAEWFYGRTDANYFWDVLPRMFEGKSLLTATPTEWKAFCKRNKIAITDLITEVTCFDKASDDDKAILASYGDTELIKQIEYFKYNSIAALKTKFPSIKQIYFTRKFDPNWKEVWGKCGVDHLAIVNELYTPSRYASYATSKWRKDIGKYDKPMSIPDFIIGKWSPVFKENGYQSKVKIEL